MTANGLLGTDETGAHGCLRSGVLVSLADGADPTFAAEEQGNRVTRTMRPSPDGQISTVGGSYRACKTQAASLFRKAAFVRSP